MKPIITILITLTFTANILSASGQNHPAIMSTSVVSYPTLKLTEISGNSSHREDKKSNKKASVEKYIKENLQDLEIDIASGAGERLDTLATFYEIEDLDTWKIQLQKNYANIFYSKDIHNIEQEIFKETKFLL